MFGAKQTVNSMVEANLANSEMSVKTCLNQIVFRLGTVGRSIGCLQLIDCKKPPCLMLRSRLLLFMVNSAEWTQLL